MECMYDCRNDLTRRLLRDLGLNVWSRGWIFARLRSRLLHNRLPMPTCLACAKGWPITTGALYGANSRRSISRWAASRNRVLGGELFYRNRNHTVSARSRGLSKGVSSRIHQTLTLLEKATSFLDQGGSEKVSFWRGALSELSAGDPKARVTGA